MDDKQDLLDGAALRRLREASIDYRLECADDGYAVISAITGVVTSGPETLATWRDFGADTIAEAADACREALA